MLFAFPKSSQILNIDSKISSYNLCVFVNSLSDHYNSQIIKSIDDMSLKIDTALLQTCQNVLHSWFKYVGFGQLKHIFKHTFAHRKLLSAGNESEVVGEKVTFSHSTETFQCQTSLLCPPHHMWRRNIQYISHVPLIEYIICISTHCAQFTHSASVHVRVYILYLYVSL